MNAVVLDGYTLNPGDLSWKELESMVNLKVYERTSPDQRLDRATNAHIILTNKVLVDKDLIYGLNKLEYVGVMATGFNVVDIEAAGSREILVSNIPSYSTPSVVQHVFGMILHFAVHIQDHSESARSGDWASNSDFCYWNYPLTELADTTLGIIGYGNIGKEVAKVAAAFGMNVQVNTDHPDDNPDVSFVERGRLVAESDYITLHTVLDDTSAGMVNRDFISSMKESGIIINTGRGGLIVENHLAEALNKGRIAGAGLDVLSSEPPTEDNPLLSAKNCLITPHIAWATKASRQRLMDTLVHNIRTYLEGKPANIINSVYLPQGRNGGAG